MREMSSKERVMTAFRHGTPDRIPIDYLTNPGIDRRLKEHFNLEFEDDEGLRQKLNVDFREIFLDYTGPDLHGQEPERKIDNQWGWKTRFVENDSGGYWDFCDFPLAGADMEKILDWPFPSPDNFNYSSVYRDASRYKENACYLGNPGLGCVINTLGFLRGMEEAFMDLALEREEGMILIDRILDIQYITTKRALEAAKGTIDFIWMGEDLGTQTGPLISETMLDSIIIPRHRRFFELAQSYNLPILFHSCGSSSWAFPRYIAEGVTAIDTLQPEAAGMDAGGLKKVFGKDLAFHGAISTAGTIVSGSPEEVSDEVRKILGIMMPGGGYMFSPSHQLQDNTPVENVLAAYETSLVVGRLE